MEIYSLHTGIWGLKSTLLLFQLMQLLVMTVARYSFCLRVKDIEILPLVCQNTAVSKHPMF